MRKLVVVGTTVAAATAVWAAVTLLPVSVASSEETHDPAPAESIQPQEPPKSPPPNRPQPVGPPIYLTFDDGPHINHTVRVLDALDQYGVKATFFVRGDEVTKYPEVLAEIDNRGHAIGNHTWSHDELTRVDTERVRWQLTRAAVVITQAAGYTPTCMRPPYGAADSHVRSVINELGLSEVQWDLDTNDWRGADASTLAERIMSARPGEIVLMHDSLGTNPTTAKAVELALPSMLEKGYHFATIPSCRK